jgi:hypothetical protein
VRRLGSREPAFQQLADAGLQRLAQAFNVALAKGRNHRILRAFRVEVDDFNPLRPTFSTTFKGCQRIGLALN